MYKHMSDLQQAADDWCVNKIPSLHRQLAEATLADLITFNRRRQGEVTKLTIEDYKETKVDMNW